MNDHRLLEGYLENILTSPKLGPQIVCHRQMPSSPEHFATLTADLPDMLSRGLHRVGIDRLYSHQARAIDMVREGKDIIAATPTASGKSLIYNLPVLEQFLSSSSVHSLYLFPVKALAQDQRNGLAMLYDAVCGGRKTLPHHFAGIYDGDTSSGERGRLRKQPPPVIITNPDMLHLSFLPYHDSWAAFFQHLRFVVLDEVHVYRGLFGAHMAWVLQRLQRISNHYGSSPRFIMLSATIGNPGLFAEKLIGRPVSVIENSGAPVAKKHVLFINPWDSAAHTASQLLESAIKRGLRTIVYTKSRKMTELISMWTKPRLGTLANKFASYRAGFLPEDRREIEMNLTNGTLLGVISTSALELGIDIGNLDLCILVGYPGSIMATWQRGGRVGRGQRVSAIILIAGEDALDQYFMQHPEDFFSRSPERAALDPLNERITRQHLHCAAAEIPLIEDEPLIAKSAVIRNVIDDLTLRGELFRERGRAVWHASRKTPQRSFDLRGGGDRLSIIHRQHGEVIGEIDAGRALHEVHPGAIYLHQSQTLIVDDLNLSGREVIVDDCKPTYYTRPSSHKQTEIIQALASKNICNINVSWGKIRVTERVTSYRKINQFTAKTIATIALELPEQVIETEGLWLDIPEAGRQLLETENMHFMGAIHAIEHAMIAMFPLLILCDRNDIGGISCPFHQQTQHASIFVYDGYSGGAGLTEQAYEVIETLLKQTERTVADCQCELGCPSCVHSPRCGSGNRPIDKQAALRLIQAIISGKLAEASAARSDRQASHPLAILPHPDSLLSFPRGIQALPEHYCVFDLETKRSAEEVGGWGKAEEMGVSVAVVYDSKLEGYVTYLENEIDLLIEHLQQANLIVGFNIVKFDYRVLMGITGTYPADLPTLDLLDEIYKQLGYRLSLNRLAAETLGHPKSADGLQALRWYKEGKIKEIADYCRKDVELTRNLLLFALEHGHLFFTNKAGATVRLPLACDATIAQILKCRN